MSPVVTCHRPERALAPRPFAPRVAVSCLAGFLAAGALACPPQAPPDVDDAELGAAPSSGSGVPETGSGTSAEAEPQEPAPPQPSISPDARSVDPEEVYALRQRLGLGTLPPLIVGDLLTRADVRELTGFRGPLAETTLEGVPPSPRYNSIRISADGGFGFALQMWQVEESRQLAPRFERLRETYIGARPDASPVSGEAFTAEFEGIRTYAWTHRESRALVVISCDAALCNAGQIRELAQRTTSRL